MVWLLNSQWLQNCKSTESFCRNILAVYTNDWSTFWYIYCCYVNVFSGKFLNVCMPRTTNNNISPLTACPTWIRILWKWASVLTKLTGDGECRLAMFLAIRNFLANEIYQFSRLSHQTNFLLGQPAPYNQLLILRSHLRKLLGIVFTLVCYKLIRIGVKIRWKRNKMNP